MAWCVAAPNARATTGWDPTTGLGSPQFEAMSAQLGAPSPSPTPTPTPSPVPNPDDGGGTPGAVGARARLRATASLAAAADAVCSANGCAVGGIVGGLVAVVALVFCWRWSRARKDRDLDAGGFVAMQEHV
jgi:hypothetical protein